MPATVPVELDIVEGSIYGETTEHTWYVPHKFYQLEQMRVWKNDKTMSGFEVKFVHYDEDYVAWHPIVHMFGTTDLNSEFETYNLSPIRPNFGGEIKRIHFMMQNPTLPGFNELLGIYFEIHHSTDLEDLDWK